MRTNAFLSVPVVVLATLALGPAPRHTAGSITGTVKFTGTPPKMKSIDMAKEPWCVTGPGDALQYVVVYVSAGDQGSGPPAQTVRYDQKNCQYIPHIAALQAGQPMEIFNNDQTSHNIHPLPKANPEWNKSQPPGAPPIQTKFDTPEFIAVKCNVHPWMHGYFAVLKTSHYAVSGNDGSFTLTGLPPGKYTLTAWHEKFGTQTQDVTVGNEPAKVDFVFKATPY
jgi:plastocyanin